VFVFGGSIMQTLRVARALSASRVFDTRLKDLRQRATLEAWVWVRSSCTLGVSA
jgi:hypothetical protein